MLYTPTRITVPVRLISPVSPYHPRLQTANASTTPTPRIAKTHDGRRNAIKTRNDRHGQQRNAEDDEHNRKLTNRSNHRTHYRKLRGHLRDARAREGLHLAAAT